MTTDSLDPQEIGTVIEWYFSGDYGTRLLQINKEPWRACVFAIKNHLNP